MWRYAKSERKNLLITGGTGLVGEALREILQKEVNTFLPTETFFLSRNEADLCSLSSTKDLFTRFQPTHVIHLAAEVGGLYKNIQTPVALCEKNIRINVNVLQCAQQANVRKLISCLSTCVFPDPPPTVPMEESMLHLGPPHFSNEGYAHAKRLLEVLSRLYNKEFSTRFLNIIPSNLYGEFDNFHLEDGHVIPALIHQCFLAKKSNKDLRVQGSGKPLRQFLYARDLGKILLWMLESYPKTEPLIVCNEEEYTISHVAEVIAKCFKFKGKLVYDSAKEDGQLRKTVSNLKLRKLLPDFRFTTLEEGLQNTVSWFENHYASSKIRR